MMMAYKSGLRFGTLLLFALALAGCSREARKARHLTKAEDYLTAHELEKAKIEYLNVLRVDYRNATAIARLGGIWFEQGAPLRAYPYLFMARELAPENTEARGKLIQVLASVEAVGYELADDLSVERRYYLGEGA
jgi:tetratricopeptide (TPR) repeat protein